jgi:AraC-like DNA-binding protein
MALFFDVAWFDARLLARGLDRAALAACAGMSADDLKLAFKDQRELAPHEVRAFAALLDADLAETAARCGVTTWVVDEPVDRLSAFEARLDAVERWIAEFEQGRAV